MIRKSIFSSLCITAFVTFFIVSLVSADTETFDETYAYKQGGGAATGGGNLPPGEIGDALARFRQSKQSANR